MLQYRNFHIEQSFSYRLWKIKGNETNAMNIQYCKEGVSMPDTAGALPIGAMRVASIALYAHYKYDES